MNTNRFQICLYIIEIELFRKLWLEFSVDKLMKIVEKWYFYLVGI
jgi:hypothetical protein